MVSPSPYLLQFFFFFSRLDFHSPAVEGGRLPLGADASDTGGTARAPALASHGGRVPSPAPRGSCPGCSSPDTCIGTPAPTAFDTWARAAPACSPLWLCCLLPSSSAWFVPVVPLAPSPAPSLGGLMGPAACSTEAWRLGDCTDNVAGTCRCHPKVGLNPPGRGKRPNKAGWMPRTGSGAGGTLKGALRKEEEAPDLILPYTEGPQEEAAAPARSRRLCFTRQSALEWEEGGEEARLQLPSSRRTRSIPKDHGCPVPRLQRESRSCACPPRSQPPFSSSTSCLPACLGGGAATAPSTTVPSLSAGLCGQEIPSSLLGVPGWG